MLKAENLGWQMGKKQILKGINLHLKKGECIGLVGPNGSGKSSLLKLLSFLETPMEGRLFFEGNLIPGKVPLSIRRQIAVVFQEALLLNASVYDNVALGLKLRGVARQEIRSRVEEWLERFGVLHLRKRQARSLSGGESQRASLARAFVLEPKVLFLDEPFSALDAPTKEALVKDLALAFRATQVSSILVSHDFTDIERLASKAVILVKGEIAVEGLPEELLSNNQDQDGGEFLQYWRNNSNLKQLAN